MTWRDLLKEIKKIPEDKLDRQVYKCVYVNDNNSELGLFPIYNLNQKTEDSISGGNINDYYLC